LAMRGGMSYAQVQNLSTGVSDSTTATTSSDPWSVNNCLDTDGWYNGSGTYCLKIKNNPTWANEPYHVHIPATYNPSSPMALIFNFHGAFGNGKGQAELTCASSDPSVYPSLNDPTCFHNMARNYIVVYPNGDYDPADPYIYKGAG